MQDDGRTLKNRCNACGHCGPAEGQTLRTLCTPRAIPQDELFVECHYFEGNFLSNLKTYRWSDCLAMFEQLRVMGVYVHEWLN